MRRWYLKPWLFGIITGSIFVFAEVLFNFYPPTAYTFCLSCHTRDLINTAANTIFRANFQTAMIARRVVMLTSPAVILGAFISSRFFKEYRSQKSNQPFLFFISGFIIMITGIIIFGCPTRIIIRSGYGDLYGIAALFGMFIGIWNGTVVLKQIVKRRSI